MLDITTGAMPVTVSAHANIPFAETLVRSRRADRACNCACGWFVHDEGSGQIILVNNSNQARVFEILFNANVTEQPAETTPATTTGTSSATTAAATTPSAVTVAIMRNAEAISGTEMDYTPATAGVYGNISANTLIQVPCGASVTVSVSNTGLNTILVSDGNLIAKRIA